MEPSAGFSLPDLRMRDRLSAFAGGNIDGTGSKTGL